MKTRLRLLLLICTAVFLLAALACLPRVLGIGGSRFSRKVEENSFSLDVYPLNGSQAEMFSLKEGDAVAVELVRMSGKLSVTIGQAGKAPVYQGNGLNLTSFRVAIPEDGDYFITVTGKGAEGRASFQIIRSRENEPL